MKKDNISPIQQKLNEVIGKEWDKSFLFLRSRFDINDADIEDIMQDSFLILYDDVLSGKLDNSTCKLSTYFNSICRNKAHERLRSIEKVAHIVDEFPDAMKDEFEDERIDSLLALEDESDNIQQRKMALVHEVIKLLHDPCDKLLWGLYRDGYSMKTLADMYGYKTENSVKVTKHRCSEEFRKYYKQQEWRLFH